MPAHSPRRRSLRFRRGAALVEFALVLPVILLFFTTSIELFRINQMRHAAASAAYEACRHVIVPGASQAEATAEAQRLARLAGIGNVNVTISPGTITESTPSVTVRVDVPAKGNSWMVSAFTDKNIVSATSTLLAERVPAVQAAGIPQATP